MHNQSTILSVLGSASAEFNFCEKRIHASNRKFDGVLIQNKRQQDIIEHLNRDKIVSVGLACLGSHDNFYTLFSDDLTVIEAKSDIAFLNDKMDGRMSFTYDAQAFLYNADRISARDTLFSLPNDLVKEALIASNEFTANQIIDIKKSNTPIEYLSNEYLCQAFSRYLAHTEHKLSEEVFASLVSFLNVCDGLFLPTIYKECGCYGFKNGRIWLISSCDNEYSAEIFASADRNNILEKWAIVAYI